MENKNQPKSSATPTEEYYFIGSVIIYVQALSFSLDSLCMFLFKEKIVLYFNSCRTILKEKHRLQTKFSFEFLFPFYLYYHFKKKLSDFIYDSVLCKTLLSCLKHVMEIFLCYSII